MATVYLAMDERLDRLVAVKVIHSHLSDNRILIKRFKNGAKWRISLLRFGGLGTLSKLVATMKPIDPTDWGDQCRHLAGFHRKFQRWPAAAEEFPNGNPLGSWCARQHTRFRKGLLSPNEMRRLIRLGFPLRLGVTYWDVDTETRLRAQDPYLEVFLLQVERLKAFRLQHPDRWPSSKSADPHRPLGFWLEHTRRAERSGLLLPYRAALLADLGFPFRGQRDKWESRYSAVQSLMQKHPLDWRRHLTAQLASWVTFQRAELKKQAMAPERRRRLEALGDDFPSLDRWAKCFRHLQAFRKQNPERWPSAKEHFPKGFDLGMWCNGQRFRFRKGKLKDHQLSALQAINFPFQAFHWDQTWMEQYRHLVAFRKRFPERWPRQGEEFPPGNGLGDWVSGQKTDYKNQVLNARRAELLTNLGMEWNSWKGVEWQKKLQDLVTWRQSHPDRWPYNSAQDLQERRLAQWLTNQKQAARKGLLRADRKQTLTRLGLLFDARLGAWLRTLQEVQAFRREHRNQWPLPGSTHRPERNLGAWIQRQLSAWKERRLTSRQMTLLHQMGFPDPPRK